MRGDNDESREVLGTITCLPAQLAWCGIGWVGVTHRQIVNREGFGEVAGNTAALDASLAAIALYADDWQGNDITHAAPDDFGNAKAQHLAGSVRPICRRQWDDCYWRP